MIPLVVVTSIHASIASPAPVTFIENQGQYDPRVLFCASSGGVRFWFTGDGVSYQFVRPLSSGQLLIDKNRSHDSGILSPDRPDSLEYQIVRQTFAGVSKQVKVSGEGCPSGAFNYFIGNDPHKWRRGVPHFTSIVYHDIYPGIDLRYYFNGSLVEYDLIVSPGVDPRQITLHYEGIRRLDVNSVGDLALQSPWGELVESRPVAYRTEFHQRLPVPVEYALVDSTTTRFVFTGDYDLAVATTIDPTLQYSTFLGGNNYDFVTDIAIDASGNAYVTGQTLSLNFPTAAAWQGSLAAEYDLFVSKLNASGDSLIYSTYIGGNGYDEGLGIVRHPRGEVRVCGWTSSTDFPTVKPQQPACGGGFDAFMLSLSGNGDSLLYSSYFGGSGLDRANDIALDRAGSTFLVGYTTSSDFPTLNAFQDTLSGSWMDAFVAGFNDSTKATIYSTYLGGSANDQGKGIAIDTGGNATIVGTTNSTDFPLQNPKQDSLGGGTDVFVTKLHRDGAGLIFSTYHGGEDEDIGMAIALSADGNANITGETRSVDFPRIHALWNSCSSCPAYSNAFVTRLNGTDGDLMFSTYLGSDPGDDIGSAVAVDVRGNIIIAGATDGDYFPVANPMQGSRASGKDAFVSALRSDGSAMLYSSYLGGGSDEEASAVSIAANGDSYVAGRTRSFDFPLANPEQNQFGGGGWDGFISRIALELPAYPCGDFDGSNRIDITDLVYLIDYVFANGNPPLDGCRGDVDCDGVTSLTDAVYMVSYIFGQGNPPCNQRE